MKRSELILDELRRIAKRNRGLLRVEKVVEEARNTSSPLHDQFEWDNKKAAHEYRLWQARELIAQYWIVEPVSQQPIRMMVSLTSDRQRGGYRDSLAVLADEDRRAELVEMAIDDLRRWQKSYGALTELRAVHAAIDRVCAKFGTAEAS